MTTHPNQLTTYEDVYRFVLAGNATFTLVSQKTDARFTYKVTTPKQDSERRGTKVSHFVALMNGPDNESDYQYLGFITEGQSSEGYGLNYVHGRKSKISPAAPSARAFAWFWSSMRRARALPDQLEFWHEGRCCRCNRKLTVPSSIASGVGPECAGKMGIA